MPKDQTTRKRDAPKVREMPCLVHFKLAETFGVEIIELESIEWRDGNSGKISSSSSGQVV